ncbi:MAG: DUF2917 domain-containing protein [Azonexus sp.]|nr:DUF2917 domain-containing protein [Azonexus sp.]
MRIDLKSGEVCLSNNNPICLRQARGMRVICTAGTIWITVTGEAGDTFLEADQAHELRSNGLAIIESIGDGRIRLKKPASFFSHWKQAKDFFMLHKKTGLAGPAFLKQA